MLAACVSGFAEYQFALSDAEERLGRPVQATIRDPER